MPLGQDEAVPLRPARILRTHTHLVKIQHGEQIRNRERAARVPRSDRMDRPDRRQSNPARGLLQFFDLHSSLLVQSRLGTLPKRLIFIGLNYFSM